MWGGKYLLYRNRGKWKSECIFQCYAGSTEIAFLDCIQTQTIL